MPSFDVTWSRLSYAINYSYFKYILGAVLIFLAFLIFRKIFTRYIFAWILKMANKTENRLDEKLLLAFEQPLRAFILVLGLFFAITYLPLASLQYLAVVKVFRSVLIILLAWGFYLLVGSESVLYQEFRHRLKMDDILIKFISRAARFIIIALTILVVAQEWDYDVNGFIAGLGLGGLAFALAAKDALANIFGGIVLILDKPFSTNDWIKTPSVEGTVEYISFRSTKVRAFDQSLVVVPNSTLANEPVTNYTRMGKRRVSFHLGVTFHTSRAQMERCVESIREMLINHPGVHPETILVYFDVFNDSSLDIFIYYFTNTTNWAEYLEVKQEVNLKVMEILEEQGVSAAFPSRSIYWENPEQIKAQLISSEEEPSL